MKIRSVEELGEAIRTRRKELHYTQAFLAEFTGFSGIGSVGGKESMSCGN